MMGTPPLVSHDLTLSSVYNGHRFGELFVNVCGVPSIGYSSGTKKARAVKDFLGLNNISLNLINIESINLYQLDMWIMLVLDMVRMRNKK
jgi:hypothetical protein